MSLELEADQSVRKNVRRMARKMMDHALEEMTGGRIMTRATRWFTKRERRSRRYGLCFAWSGR